MPARTIDKHLGVETATAQKAEMADAHCHLDLFKDMALVKTSIERGVLTIVTDGINLETSKAALALSDNAHIFPAVGMDPETAISLSDSELDAAIGAVEELARTNARRIVAIGEIGLDYVKAWEEKKIVKQKMVFGRMLDLALELNLPVSVHARSAIADVMEILDAKGMKKVQLHYFEGDSEKAKQAEESGYMISIPPAATTARKAAIKYANINSLMAESDSPVVGKTPKDVEIAIGMVAEIKGIPFDRAAEALTLNTKRFFNIHPGRGHAKMARG
jgi:TatD DNase family protein